MKYIKKNEDIEVFDLESYNIVITINYEYIRLKKYRKEVFTSLFHGFPISNRKTLL